MKAGGDFFGQHDLGVARVATALNLGLQSRDGLQALEAEQGEPAPHQGVADRQDLGKHGVGVFGDADVVVFAFGHFVHAVQAFQQGHGQDALRLLAVLLLQMAAHEQVEFLVGAAQLQVAFQGHAVVALHQRVQKLMHADGLAAVEALVKIVTLHHPRHGVARSELDHAAGPQRLAPLAVVANLGFGWVQHHAGLLVIGVGIELDLLRRQRRSGAVTPRWVADQ